MFIIPAIDIIDGKCARLTQGNFAKPTVYSISPVEIAKKFENNGAKFLHIVDLDGAKSGFPVNAEIIFAIVKSVNVPVQVGGGIRTYQQAKTYLENGIEKIILATVTIENQNLLERLVKVFGNSRIAVSVDIKDGEVATRGWLKKGNKPVSDIVSLLKKIGIRYLIVTDISKDGLLAGPNFDLSRQFIKEGFKVIAAGGVSSLSDIEEFNKLGAFAVIVGKAIYEDKIALGPAQKAVDYKNELAKRIIPCLDVKNGRVVKGTHFRDLRDAGDPVELGKRYCELGADELVFLDIAAGIENRKTFCELVKKIAKEINIPFTVGGGILCLEDIKTLLNAGADKVSIGSAAVKEPDLVKRAAKYFGSQCIVISVDAKRKGKSWKIHPVKQPSSRTFGSLPGFASIKKVRSEANVVSGAPYYPAVSGISAGLSYWVYIKGGTEETEIDAIKFSEQMEQLGAGELLVNSLDRDGTKKGFDLELLRSITDSVNIPVIASSGAGSEHDFLDVFQKTGVDAALAASIFHEQEIDIGKLKKFLFDNNITVRL